MGYDIEKEKREAIEAGQRALSSLRTAKENLNSAKNWGLVDMFGGGFFSTMLKHSLKQGGVRCKQYTSFQTYLQLPESIKSRIIFIRCVSEPLIDHHPVCFSPGIPGKNS